MEESNSFAQAKAVSAIQALGCGFDVTLDLKLEYAKSSQSRLIHLNEGERRELVLPGDVVCGNVSKDIKFDTGENTRYRSDVLDFHQMSERFNQNLGITGKMPLGLFTSMFEFKGPWQVDAYSTKSLALDGYFASLYELRVTKSPLTLRQEVKEAVPSTWQPSGLARFIERFGTHIITGIKIGGKDVIYLKQKQASSLSAADIQKLLEGLAEERFVDPSGGTSGLRNFKKGARKKVADPFASVDRSRLDNNYGSAFMSSNNVEVMCRRRGGIDSVKEHSLWLTSVPSRPEVVSMSFVPITSLLSGVAGTGFLTHAINLYLRYKPPVEELHYFLEFQIPRQWTPPLELPSKVTSSGLPVLQFSPFGAKLHVSLEEATVGRLPVTGLRLYAQGKKRNRLSIHVQYLASLPRILESHWGTNVYSEAPVWKRSEEDPRWFEPVLWKSYSQVNTAPVEFVGSYIGDKAAAFVVTGAQLQVSTHKTRNVLSLRLQFTRIPGCSIRRSLWDNMPTASQKSSSGFFSQLGLSSSLSSTLNPSPRPERFCQNSAVFAGEPSPSAQNLKMQKYVDVTEMSKGIQDQPGHWIVTGAKLDAENGKVLLKVKYSLLRY